MAFLDILTRHMPQRKYMLRANDACLKAQSDPDFKQWVLVDEKRRGWQHAAAMLMDVAPKLKGEYVLILDDDDLMINSEAICLLKEATQSQPAAVIFRGWHDDLGVLPGVDVWMRRPRLATIGAFDFITRRDVFCELVGTTGVAGYCNDFAIIDAVFERDMPRVWLDRLLCAVMKRSRGK
jgi:hypothetical protein